MKFSRFQLRRATTVHLKLDFANHTMRVAIPTEMLPASLICRYVLFFFLLLRRFDCEMLACAEYPTT